ncbi:MAG: 8-amino-7-oxononanoate synthase [Methylosarcina sp.]
MAEIFSQLAEDLESIAARGLYRSRRIASSPQGVVLTIDGRTLLNFCSNDYLGLANHPSVVAAFKRGADRYGIGSGSAHLLCGHSSAHHALEEELAEFTGRARSLLFSTGYMANMGIISALAERGDTVLEDRLNHASLLDGGLLSAAQFKRYRHVDLAHLEANLAESSGRKLIVTDGVFSMDGDLAPMDQLSLLAQQQNAWLMVDDAHGLGVIGKRGGGILEHYSLNQNDVPILMGTLGKALGTFGAFVAGSHELIETLIQKARTYIYTTALPPAIAEATRASLKIVAADLWRRDKLASLVQHFSQGAKQLGLSLLPSASAIQPVIIGDSQQTMSISKALLEQGFLVGAIRPPTVPTGSARLRITFSALHEEHHIDRLLDAFERILAQRQTAKSTAE